MGAVTIGWTRNGVPVSAHNGKTVISEGCSTGATTTFGATVTDSTTALCRSGSW